MTSKARQTESLRITCGNSGTNFKQVNNGDLKF